jgi:hypothetical protein
MYLAFQASLQCVKERNFFLGNTFYKVTAIAPWRTYDATGWTIKRSEFGNPWSGHTLYRSRGPGKTTA